MGPRVTIGTMQQFVGYEISLDDHYEMEESYQGIFRCIELFRNFLKHECLAMVSIAAQTSLDQNVLDSMGYIKDCLDSYMEMMDALSDRVKEFGEFEDRMYVKVLKWDSDRQMNFERHEKIKKCFVGLYGDLEKIYLQMQISINLDDPNIEKNLHGMLYGLQSMIQLLKRFE
jgi:hypothetical protein